jgi:hypothetical protein
MVRQSHSPPSKGGDMTKTEVCEALDYAVQLYYEYGAQDEQHHAIRLRTLKERIERGIEVPEFHGDNVRPPMRPQLIIGWSGREGEAP